MGGVQVSKVSTGLEYPAIQPNAKLHATVTLFDTRG